MGGSIAAQTKYVKVGDALRSVLEPVLPALFTCNQWTHCCWGEEKKSLKFQDLSLLKRQLIVNCDHAPRDRWRQPSRPVRLPASTTASTGMVANFHLTLLHSTASKSISRANRGVVLSLTLMTSSSSMIPMPITLESA